MASPLMRTSALASDSPEAPFRTTPCTVANEPDSAPGLRHVAGRMVMVDLDADPDSIAPVVEGVRIFAGYSGWTIGQLEGEIERDDWIVLSALPSDVLVQPRVDLWGRVLRRQPLPLALLATHPIDISRN